MIINRLLTILICLIFSPNSHAVESLSYSGRLVNANGSPVSGPVNLQFKLSYTDAPTVAICTKTINGVALTNGVFHTKLDFTTPECGGTLSLMQVLAATPVNESVAIQVTDLSHSKTYSYQAVHSVPSSLMATMAKTLDSLGATAGQYLKWDGTKWIPAAAGTGSGSVTQIDTGTGLSGGPITTTGTISIANGGVDTTQLANSAVTDAKVSATAAITRTKLANGTASHIVVNDASGVMSSVAVLPLGQGGTGATTVPGVWTVLGLGTAAGKDVGAGVGKVMASDGVPNCFAFEKLQMSVGPAFAWTCVTDANTDTTKLPLAGGTMAGDIDMDANQIINLSAPILGSDAANKTYVDAAVSGSAVWGVTSGHAHRLTGNVGVNTVTPTRNVQIFNSDADEALLVTRAANASDEATIGFAPNGANTTSNQSWKVGLPVNSNNLSVSAYDGSTTTNVLLLSPVGMIIPRLTTTERDAVVAPATGSQIYNISSNELNYYNGTAWKALGVAGAGVTSLVAGTGLTGGTITSSGTIAVDVGTGPNKIVQLDGSSKLPAVDGSALTNLTPANLSAPVPITKGGTGLSAAGAGNTLVGMNNAGTAMEYKVISGTGVTVTNGAGTMNFAVTGAPPTGAASGDLSGTYPGPTVAALQGTAVSATVPASGNILLYNGSAYAPTAVSGDASLSSAGLLTLGTVPVSKGGTGVTSLTAKGIVSVSATGNSLASTVCADKEVLSFNATGDTVCSSVTSLSATDFVQDGNSFAASAVLGTNDNNSLNFETNATTKMTILPNGNVGIGTIAPITPLHIAGSGMYTAMTIDSLSNKQANYSFSKNGVNKWQFGMDFAANGTSDWYIYDAANTKARIYIDSTGNINFGAGATNAYGGTSSLVIKSTGLVGIGATAPSSKLHIKDGGVQVQDAPVVGATRPSFVDVQNGLEIIKIHSKGGSGAGYVTAPTDNLYLGSSSFEQALTIKLDGNVGIGNTSPNGKLQVKGAIAYETNNSTNYVSLKAPDSLAATYALTFPSTAGSNGYALITNGAGVLSWGSVATTASTVGGDLSGTIANAQIIADAVGTTEIANGSVTYAKLNLTDGDIPFAKIAPFTTTNVPEGTNKYFTDARVSAALMSSYATGTAIPLAPTDTLNQALGKLEAQIIANDTAVDGMWNKTGANVHYNAGNVGIGTTSPTSSLQIRNASAATVSGTELLKLESAHDSSVLGSGGVIRFSNSMAASDAATIKTFTNGSGDVSLTFQTGYGALADRMTIANNGNVGIGTSTPGDKLEVRGDVRLGTASEGYLFSKRTGQILIGEDASAVLINAGVGGAGAAVPMYIGRANTDIVFSNDTAQERMRIATGGNIGIGTNTPAYALDVNGSMRASSILFPAPTGDPSPVITARVVPAGQGAAPEKTELILFHSNDNPDGSGVDQITLRAPALSFQTYYNAGVSDINNPAGYNERMYVASAGNVGIGTTNPSEKLDVTGNVKAVSFISTSDRRLKTNLQKVSGLQTLNQLTGYRFDWKNNGETEYGIMAQDVEKVMPQAVLTDKKTGLKSVKYNSLIAPVIEAIKELYSKINGSDKVIKEQTREIASLKKKNDELEMRLQKLENSMAEKTPKKK